MAASPATGVDTITGEGLAEVMAGADVVVDVSNAPVWDDDAVLEFFTTSTRNLLAAERDAGVGHHLAVSIVGADRLPDSGYLRAKVAQEAEIEAGGIPFTILRATQFFEFLPQIVETGAEGDSVRLSTGLMQLVAADDVAATVAELATGAPVGGRVELGGPEALGIDAWARRLFAATGDERTVVGDPHARYFGTELDGGELTPGDGARIGTIDFDAWFAAQPQEAGDERDPRDRHGPRGGLRLRGRVLVCERADGRDGPARGAAAPGYRPSVRRRAVAGGHRQPVARAGRGRRAAGGLLRIRQRPGPVLLMWAGPDHLVNPRLGVRRSRLGPFSPPPPLCLPLPLPVFLSLTLSFFFPPFPPTLTPSFPLLFSPPPPPPLTPLISHFQLPTHLPPPPPPPTLRLASQAGVERF